jgi:hypothetical protein
VFRQMNPDNHEFLIRHTKSRAAYISWIDEPLRAVAPRKQRSSLATALMGRP